MTKKAVAQIIPETPCEPAESVVQSNALTASEANTLLSLVEPIKLSFLDPNYIVAGQVMASIHAKLKIIAQGS